MTKIIVVYSGGLDSFTLLNEAIRSGKDVSALSFDYGQKHNKELHFVEKFCAQESIDSKIVNVSSIKELFQGSSLTDEIDIPKGHYEDDSMKSTVVPNRNMILISLALGYAVTKKAEEVWFGAHAGDHAIYPDCRPEFVEKMDAVARIANYSPIAVKAPYIAMSKTEILAIGLNMQLDYGLTWTCYEGKELACGSCGACHERLESFAANNIIDPIKYS
ncbi:7-cyano-7-deazaguanine synthase QueC [Gammaproteobacteria bacterium]|nr:7-cyano-7-deazaguanine synthase QueC [Gammaproteobacteria bacterium]